MKLLAFAPAVFALAAGSSTAADYMAAAQQPPAGIAIEQAPMFVSIGFDDNGYSGVAGSGYDGGMSWANDFFRNLDNPSINGNPDTFDGSDARVTFFFTSYYISTHVSEAPGFVKQSWRTAFEDGHGIANHTENHLDGESWSQQQWADQLQMCENWLTKPYDANNLGSSSVGIGATLADITGSRSPFLHYNDALLTELNRRGYRYDASIEDGWQPEHDGTNYFWPYTLDHGSPGHDYLYTAGIKDFVVNEHPGMWETPVHPLVVPPDHLAAQYGLSYSLRNKVKSVIDHFDVVNGKITALDYTLWVEAKMNKAEVLATLKYTLDLRLQGNRAPMLFGAHTDEYSDKYTYAPNATTRERQEAIEEFVLYALSKPEVRIRPYEDVIDWMNNPAPLSGDYTPSYQVTAAVKPELDTTGACTAPQWSATTDYVGGSQVSYNNHTYEAKWWTRNNQPDVSNEWQDLGSCATVIETYHATITPASQSVAQGSDASFSINLEPGYQISAILVNNQAVAIANPLVLSNVQSAMSVLVEVAADDQPLEYFTLTAQAALGGSITPNGSQSVLAGSDVTYQITANSGYEIADVLVNGVSQGAVSTVTLTNVQAEQTVAASFAEVVVVQYDITASASVGGSITPAGVTSVVEGNAQNYSIIADAGYEIADVIVNGASVGKVSSYSFSNVAADQTISASFSLVEVVEYQVSVSAGNGGSVTPAGSANYVEGSNLSISITPDAGFVVDQVLVNGVNVGAVTSYQITNLQANTQVAVSFKVLDQSCSASAWQNGVVYTAGDQVSHQGELYEAKWYTDRDEPGTTGEWGVWKELGSC